MVKVNAFVIGCGLLIRTLLFSHDINDQLPVNGKHVPTFRALGIKTMEVLKEEFPAYMAILEGDAGAEQLDLTNVKFTMNDLELDIHEIPLLPPGSLKDSVTQKRDKVRAFLNAHYGTQHPIAFVHY